jgi:hypothetical protein
MRAEQHSSEALTGEETGLGAVKLYFFEFLAALALEFCLWKRGVPCELADELQQRLGKFREAGEADGAVVGTGVGGKIRAEAPQVFFDLAAKPLGGASPHDGGGHFGKTGPAVNGGGVAGAKKKLAMKFGDGV